VLEEDIDGHIHLRPAGPRSGSFWIDCRLHILLPGRRGRLGGAAGGRLERSEDEEIALIVAKLLLDVAPPRDGNTFRIHRQPWAELACRRNRYELRGVAAAAEHTVKESVVRVVYVALRRGFGACRVFRVLPPGGARLDLVLFPHHARSTSRS